MANYRTPGVYVEEISTLPASVAQVETAIPAFIGYTEKAELNGENIYNEPTRITSLPEYEEMFGGPDHETTFSVTINEDADGNKTTTVLAPTTRSKYLMWYSMKMYFDNGGGPAYIVSIGHYTTTANGAVNKDLLSGGLSPLEKEDEPTLILFPDITGLYNPSTAGTKTSSSAVIYGIYASALSQCNDLKDRFTIMDTPSGSDGDDDLLRDNLTSDYLKYGAAYYPHLKTTLSYSYEDTGVQLVHNLPNDEDDNPVTGDHNGTTMDALKSADNELYNQITAKLIAIPVVMPPSSAMAGIYARVDTDRGVWKAPANVSVNNVIMPTVKITNTEQDGLNVDPTAGKSINAIRSFTGKGPLVWGARTLDGNSNEWRYVSVRRFYNMVEESVKKATERVVFEPNDANTWIKSKAQIENFLNNLWRQGALAGAVPDQAFFVNIGLGQTMTALDILEGRMIIEIGMAVVRPAEFIILRFSHKMQES